MQSVYPSKRNTNFVEGVFRDSYHEDLHMYAGVSWRHNQICSLVNLFWWPDTVITRMSRSNKWRGSRRFADGIGISHKSD